MTEISKDKKYITQDGREVRIYSTDAGGNFPIHGAAKRVDDSVWITYSWDKIGRSISMSTSNLVEVKPEQTGWLNVYRSSSMALGRLWDSEQEARDNSSVNCIARLQVTFREGDGL